MVCKGDGGGGWDRDLDGLDRCWLDGKSERRVTRDLLLEI